MKLISSLPIWFGLIGGFFGQILGGWDGFLICLTVFMVTDYITGVMAAAQQGKLSSAQGFKGILKKLLILLVVGMSHLLDQTLLGGSGEPLRSAMIFFYLSNEGLSILENIRVLGVRIPKKLDNFLEKMGE